MKCCLFGGVMQLLVKCVLCEYDLAFIVDKTSVLCTDLLKCTTRFLIGPPSIIWKVLKKTSYP